MPEADAPRTPGSPVEVQAPVATGTAPLVSVVTPAFNGADHLAECIESVLAQTYPHWEHVILDNCSTDGTHAVAQSYAERDPRIRLIRADVHFAQMPNFNRALRHMSPASKYCKFVLADDWIFPRCLEEMVAVAERGTNVGVVGAYSMYGDRVSHFGLAHSPLPILPGKEAARRFLMGAGHFLGSATCLLLRCDLIRARERFFDESYNPFADTDAFLSLLQASDFGFVFQLLTYNRRDNQGYWSRIEPFEPMLLQDLLLFHKYGRSLVEETQYRRYLATLEQRYYFMLADHAVRGYGAPFWEFHKRALGWIGSQIDKPRLAWGIAKRLGDMALNPKSTLEQLFARHRS